MCARLWLPPSMFFHIWSVYVGSTFWYWKQMSNRLFASTLVECKTERLKFKITIENVFLEVFTESISNRTSQLRMNCKTHFAPMILSNSDEYYWHFEYTPYMCVIFVFRQIVKTVNTDLTCIRTTQHTINIRLIPIYKCNRLSKWWQPSQQTTARTHTHIHTKTHIKCTVYWTCSKLGCSWLICSLFISITFLIRCCAQWMDAMPIFSQSTLT